MGTAPAEATLVRGAGAAPGRGEGRVLRHTSGSARAARTAEDDANAAGAKARADERLERERLRQALRAVDADLRRDIAAGRRRGLVDIAEIFEAHRAILADPALARDLGGLLASGARAETAVDLALGTWQERLRALPDPRLQARADDLVDLARRLLRLLARGRDGKRQAHDGGVSPAAPDASVPHVLVAEWLGPSDTVRLDPARVRAIVTERGGPFAHAAIVARSLGIPAVVGVGTLPAAARSGAYAVVDGDAGWAAFAASAGALAPWRRTDAPRTTEPRTLADASPPAAQAGVRAGAQAAGGRRRSACTLADGTPIALRANIGDERDAAFAAAEGAMGVGLWRTEWLYLGTGEPSEQRLAELFAAVAARFAPEPVTVRLIDAGGDKPVAAIPTEPARNPALARRGIRALALNPALFDRQLAALLVAAARAPNLRLMVPMASRPAEIATVRARLAALATDLERAGRSAARTLAVGAMVEVPAVAAALGRFAPVSDFFSLGTNDLAQYALAADRDDPSVASLLDGLDPGVLRLVALTAQTARRSGRELSVCGEAAGETWALPLLVGAGLRAFSVAPARLSAVRAALATLEPAACARLYREALGLEDGAAVRRRVDAVCRPS